MNKQRALKATGFFLVAMGLCEAMVLGWSYGFSQGIYFWFYHIAVIGLGVALLLKDRALVLAFLSAATVPMGAYLIEHLAVVFGGPSFLELTRFLYNPGMNSWAFLLGHSHFFFWPAAFAGWLWLPAKKNTHERSIHYIVGFHAFVWAMSYWAFPDHQNVNCIHGPCFDWVPPVSDSIYRLCYVSTLFLLNIAFLFGWEWLAKKPSKGKKFDRRYTRAIAGCAGFFLVVTAWDCFAWSRRPHFNCQQAYEDPTVRIGCDYTAEWGSEKMMLVYSVFNKHTEPRFCTSRIEINGEEQPLHDDIWAEPGKRTEIWVVLPYPKTDTSARLLATCKD